MKKLIDKDNQTNEDQVIIWDRQNDGWLRQKQITTVQAQKDEIQYIDNGIIVYIQKIDPNENIEIIQNLEQAYHLKWFGKKENGKKKVGKWVAKWKNVEKDIGGYYDNQGLKQGFWKEIFENYWDLAQITYVGIYYCGKKIDRWNTIFNNKIIGGGVYSQKGQKTGQWLELDLKYFYHQHSECDITYQGEYLDGRKIGYWQYFSNKIIGGGLYNQNGEKNGHWIELIDSFSNVKKLIKRGSYKNGKAIGKWETTDLKGHQIGVGYYDGNGIKIGRWKELFLDWREGRKENTYIGQYYKGKKIGLWDTLSWCEKVIGSGIYDQKGNKRGKWKETNHNWDQKFTQISYLGEYHSEKKNGKWDIYDNYNIQEKLIGGGIFKDGLKDGYWVDAHEDWKSRWRSIIFKGEYKMGKKIGKWMIMETPNREIGGGDYNGNGRKNGKWIDMNDNWDQNNSEIIFVGNYKKGLKIGMWQEIDILNGRNHQLNNIWYDEYGIIIN